MLGLCWRQPDEDGGYANNSIPHSFKPSLRKLAVIYHPRYPAKGRWSSGLGVARVVSWRVGPSQGKLPKSADDNERNFNQDIYHACWRLNIDFKVWCMLSILYSRSVHLSPAFIINMGFGSKKKPWFKVPKVRPDPKGKVFIQFWGIWGPFACIITVLCSENPISSKTRLEFIFRLNIYTGHPVQFFGGFAIFHTPWDIQGVWKIAKKHNHIAKFGCVNI